MAHITLMQQSHPPAASSNWTAKAQGNEVELQIWNIDHPCETDVKICQIEMVGSVLCGSGELIVGSPSDTNLDTQGVVVGPNQSWSLQSGMTYKWKIKSAPFKAVVAVRKLY